MISARCTFSHHPPLCHDVGMRSPPLPDASRAASVCEADEAVWLDDEMRQGQWLASSQSHLDKSLSVKSRGITLKKTKQNNKTQPSVAVQIQQVIIVNVFGGLGENVKSKKAVLSIFYNLIAYFITLMIYIIMRGVLYSPQNIALIKQHSQIYRMKDCKNNKRTSLMIIKVKKISIFRSYFLFLDKFGIRQQCRNCQQLK